MHSHERPSQRTTLNLESALLTDETFPKALHQFLASTDGIVTQVKLSRNALSTPSITLLAQLSAQHITMLNISHNQLIDMSPLAICRSLKTLNISNNRISDLSPVQHMQQLIALIANNNSIEHINLGGCSKTLQTLVLSQNILTDGSFDELHRLDQLEKLSASGNKLTRIPQLPQSLAELRLNSNHISDTSQLKGPRLKLLDLGNNKLNSFADIAALRQMPYLRNVNLSGNLLCNAVEYKTHMLELVKLIAILDSKKIDNELYKRIKQNPLNQHSQHQKQSIPSQSEDSSTNKQDKHSSKAKQRETNICDRVQATANYEKSASLSAESNSVSDDRKVDVKPSSSKEKRKATMLTASNISINANNSSEPSVSTTASGVVKVEIKRRRHISNDVAFDPTALTDSADAAFAKNGWD